MISYDNSTLESIINGIENDFLEIIICLKKSFSDANSRIRNTYEGYDIVTYKVWSVESNES